MGLFEQAIRVKNPILQIFIDDKKKSGLLDRVKLLSTYDYLLNSFRNLLKSFNSERGGILYPSPDGISVLLFNTGFDLTTSKRFCPDLNNFSEKYPENLHWYTESTKNLDQFFTYFSSHEAESLRTLYICPIRLNQNTQVFLILADSMLNIQRKITCISNQVTDFTAFCADLQQNKLTLLALSQIAAINQSRSSVLDHTQSAINTGKNAALITISFASFFSETGNIPEETDNHVVYNAIIHRLSRQAGASNLVHVCDNFNVHVVLFTTILVDTELYYHQVIKPLEKIFGIQRISQIQLAFNGTSTDVREITDFVFGED